MWSFSNGALSISYLVSECKTTIFTCIKCASPIGLHCKIIQTRLVIVKKRRGEIEKHIYEQVDYVYCYNSNEKY